MPVIAQHWQAVFAAAGNIRLDSSLPLPPRQEIASYAPLPHVMPLLAQSPTRVPHVLVAAGRAGDQVLTVSSTGEAAKGDVTGESWPVHKVSTGGSCEAVTFRGKGGTHGRGRHAALSVGCRAGPRGFRMPAPPGSGNPLSEVLRAPLHEKRS